MSTTSIKPIETLKGIFSAPKGNNGRNFLRENKLSLRELQRVTSNRQMAKEQQQFQEQTKYLRRRGTSQQRHVAEKRESGAMPRCPSCTRIGGGGGSGGNFTGSQSGGGLSGLEDTSARRMRNSSARTTGSVTVKPSCHKQIQTEDIQDEHFLYNALKKCTSNDGDSMHSQNGLSYREPGTSAHSLHHQTDEENEAAVPQGYEPEQMLDVDPLPLEEPQNMMMSPRLQQHSARHYESERQAAAAYPNNQHYPPHFSDEQYEPLPSSHHSRHSRSRAPSEDRYAPSQHSRRSRAPEVLNDISGFDRPPTMSQETQYSQREREAREELKDKFEQLSVKGSTHKLGHGDQEMPMPLSGRSRQSAYSQQSSDSRKKRGTGSVHKLGSRDDIRLPRYLEREKRERESLREQEFQRDPNCPPGHIALTEEERVTALSAAENKFQSLISELNHMPMTTETLRIRNRKNDIEKELQVLEHDIRVFSKPKVYVRQLDWK